ncbi:aspartyl protease family protein [Quercus suber]|uniref:Aspartyl protease family protein n=1 Tax=Quercus suber TaxID=58331 RepID=A0AAW0JG70_QUESU
MVTLSLGQSFYGLNLIGISVDGLRLSIPTLVFSTMCTIIDSGTVITRLPPTAYNALRTTFQKMMHNHPMTSSKPICFNSAYKLFFFNGDVSMDLEKVGVLVMLSQTKACLAFAGNGNPSDVAVFGNEQQKGLEVVYDVVGELGLVLVGLAVLADVKASALASLAVCTRKNFKFKEVETRSVRTMRFNDIG